MNSPEWKSLDAGIRGCIEELQLEVPVSVKKIADELGLKVLAATLPAGVSGEIRPEDGAFAVRVNRHDSKVRQRFTVAHEIAHYLLHRKYIGSGISDDALYRSSLSDAREAQANRLAADILMPEKQVRCIYSVEMHRSGQDLVYSMAKRFQVSEAAMRIRLDQLQLNFS